MTSVFAEYTYSPELSLALKPANRSFETAAAVPVAALTALHRIRESRKIQQSVTRHSYIIGVLVYDRSKLEKLKLK